MADEPMIVEHEANGEEASVPAVNGVESKDEKVEVSLDAKETVSDAAEVEAKSDPREMEEVSESALRLNYDESSIEDQSKNISGDDISTPPVDQSKNDSGDDISTPLVGAEENGKEENSEAALDIPETPATNKGRKRKVSSDDEVDLTGFDTPSEPSPLIKYRVDKLEKDIREAEIEKQRWRSSRPPPAKRSHLASPAHSIEIPSRPSSGLSLRSESELIGGNGSDLNSSAANSPNPFPKGRKSTVDLANPLFRAPLELGWKRELVYRAVLDQHQRRQGDIYYYSPQGKKLRSTREVSEHISGSGLTIENFTFFKEPLGIDDPEKEIIRDAKMMRGGGSTVGYRTESPVPTPEKQGPVGLIREGKRTPKPKGPKGASPERGLPSSPKLSSHFKVKSLGSRLSNQSSPVSPAPKTAAKDTPKSGAKKAAAVTQTKKNTAPKEPHMYVTQSQSVVGNSLPRYPPPLTKYGIHSGAMSPKSGRELCSIHCPLAAGQVPSLQCSLCLCLYHVACQGQPQHQNVSFVCKSCQIATEPNLSPPPLTHVSAMKPSLKAPATTLPAPPGLQRAPPTKEPPQRIPQPLLIPVIKRFPVPKVLKTVSKLVPVPKSDTSSFNEFRPIQSKKKGIVGSVTTWLPPSSSIRIDKPSQKAATPSNVADIVMAFPQTIAIVNGKKYIVVAKHNVVNVSSQFPGNGSNLTQKRAENAPKLTKIDSKTLAGSPALNTSKSIVKEEGELDESGEHDKSFDTSIDDDIKSEKTSGESSLLEDEHDCKVELKVEGDQGTGADPHSKAVVESPAEKKRAKVVPVSPTKAAASPKPTILSKSPKVSKAAANGTPAKRGRVSRSNTEEAKAEATSTQSHEAALSTLMQCGMFVQIFGYLNKRELAAAARVCRAWRDVAYTPSLWRSVRMKNSQVTDWQGLAAALKRQGTRHIDLRKMLLPPDDVTHQIWEQFIKHISTVDTLLRLEMCRCPAQVVERVCAGLPQLQSLWACSVRCNKLDLAPLAGLHNLTELRIKGMSGLFLSSDLKCLENLKNLKHLSLTSVRELEKQQCRSLGSLVMLEQLELGDCTFSGEEGAALLAPLQRLTKLRLERSPSDGSSLLMGAVARLPKLAALELINFDIKTGFEDALGQCSQLKRLLIIPMYISQSATTNRCVLEGVLRLSKTLTHLVWGVTIELLRVTELFIDQCNHPVGCSAPPKKFNMGDCIPVLKPVPGMLGTAGPPEEPRPNQRGPAQVEILPLPSLQRLLTSELPDTRLKILRIPFHATTRQALVDLD